MSFPLSIKATIIDYSGLLVSDIIVSNNLAYMYVMDKGLQIVNISDPYEPQFVSHLKMDYHFTDDLTIENNNLYFSAYNVENNTEEFIILDISTPETPTFVNKFQHELPTITSFYISNSLLFFPHDILEIINVSDPKLPVTIGEYTIGSVKGICFKENNAIILSNSGLHIINVSIPSNPTLISNFSNITGSFLSLENNYAIVSRFRAVQILDISNVSNIAFVSSLAVEYLRGHSVSNQFIYYMKSGVIYTNMIGIITFLNPLTPIEITVYNVEEDMRKIFAVDLFVYIATVYSGLLIMDVSQPYNPKIISHYDIFLPFVRTRNILLISFFSFIGVALISILIRRILRISK
jgi:hypothetical protein